MASRTDGTESAPALPAPSGMARFLAEPDPARAMALWAVLHSGDRIPQDPEEVRSLLQRSVALLDELLTAQVNAILHAPAFQRLEASWRGLHYLAGQVADLGETESRQIKIRVLNVTRRELVKDMERSIEFDQSTLFAKVYGEEFGTAGGEPFCVLLGDFEFNHFPEDVGLLSHVASVGTAAFCPFVAGASPTLFGVDTFRDLQGASDLNRIFAGDAYAKWKSLRSREDTRFVALTMPRVLARVPYGEAEPRADGFCFREDTGGPAGSGYLWGTAVYAFGSVLARSFANSGWLADIRGIQEGVLAGGVVDGLPIHSFRTDRPGVASKSSTDLVVTDHQERDLGELGFVALSRCKGTDYSVFFGNQSLHSPPPGADAAAANARLSATLQYMFCASRFAHYLKVIARDWVGSFNTPEDCELKLQQWITEYCNASDTASMDQKARYPLREALIQVRETPGKKGVYYSVIHLRPHFYLEQVDASVRLVTTVANIQPR